MKHILILIMLIGFIYSQDLTPEKVITEALLNKNIGKFITAQILLEYIDDCRNDTTWVEKKLYNRAPELFSFYEYYREENGVFWLSKKPTLSGAIQWLK